MKTRPRLASMDKAERGARQDEAFQRMDETGEKAIIKYPEDCMCCDACEFDCPVNAIYISPEKYAPLMVSWC